MTRETCKFCEQPSAPCYDCDGCSDCCQCDADIENYYDCMDDAGAADREAA